MQYTQMFLNRYQLRSDYAFEARIIPLFEPNVDDHGFLLLPSFFILYSADKSHKGFQQKKKIWFDILFGNTHNKQIRVSVYRIKLHACCNHSALEINGK